MFGETFFAKCSQKIQSKLKNKGHAPFCCGAAKDHSVDKLFFNAEKKKLKCGIKRCEFVVKSDMWLEQWFLSLFSAF